MRARAARRPAIAVSGDNGKGSSFDPFGFAKKLWDDGTSAARSVAREALYNTGRTLDEADDSALHAIYDADNAAIAGLFDLTDSQYLEFGLSLAYYDHSFAMTKNGTMIVSEGVSTSPIGASLMGGSLYEPTPDGVRRLDDTKVDKRAAKLFSGLASTVSGGVVGGYSVTVSPTADVFGVARGLTTPGVTVADTYGRTTTDSRDILPGMLWHGPSDDPQTATPPITRGTVTRQPEETAGGNDLVIQPADDSGETTPPMRGGAVTQRSEGRGVASDAVLDPPSPTEIPQQEDPVLPSFEADLVPDDLREDNE